MGELEKLPFRFQKAIEVECMCWKSTIENVTYQLFVDLNHIYFNNKPRKYFLINYRAISQNSYKLKNWDQKIWDSTKFYAFKDGVKYIINKCGFNL